MNEIAKVALTFIGVLAQSIVALMVIGSNGAGHRLSPVVILTLIQAPLITAIWSNEASFLRRTLAYVFGVAASLLIGHLTNPHLQGAAISLWAGIVREDAYGSTGAALIILSILFGWLVCGIIVPRAIIKSAFPRLRAKL